VGRRKNLHRGRSNSRVRDSRWEGGTGGEDSTQQHLLKMAGASTIRKGEKEWGEGEGRCMVKDEGVGKLYSTTRDGKRELTQR